MVATGSAAHLISVSTAYVASTHQGEAKEELLSENRFTLDIDWEEEVTAARRLRDDLQAASRRPDRLAGFTKEARAEIGGAGDHLLATRAEKIREEWVRTRAGRRRHGPGPLARWPDAYPFTKAMGERALVASTGLGKVPITFVRPSIIESALAEPRPGWIRGFRMAEPIIVSYARGLLREFPGVPEGVIDVIPVDLVVAAILAVAARGPEPGGPTVFHVASGVRNPLAYGRLVELAQDWFSRNPLYDDRGQPISVPEWSFPGRGRVQRQLRRADQAMTVARAALDGAARAGQAGRAGGAARGPPRPGQAGPRLRRALRRLHRDRGPLPRRPAHGAVGHPRRGRPRRRSASIPASSTGTTTSTTSTCRRWSSTPACAPRPGRSVVEKRPERARRAILSPDRHLAVFDLEHTLMASNVVDTYAWLASRHLPADRRARFVADLVRQAPSLLALDRRDRGDFLRSFYRRYEDAPVAQLRADSWELFHRQLLTRSFPDGLRPGPRAPRPRPSHPADHRCPRLRHGARAAALRRHRLRPHGRARRALDRAPQEPAPHRRGPGPRAGRLRRRPTASRSRSRWPTPIRPATWPCSKRSGSRSPSTPRPAWPPSPAGGAGTSSTGPRPRAARTDPCPSGPST